MTKKLPLLLLLLAACGDQSVNLGGNYKVAAFVPPIANPNIDLLFVVDSSGSMLDNQAALAAHAKAALFDVIDAAIDMPNLHVGVITPDLGTNGINAGDPACQDNGDEGRMLTSACGGITGNYLVDVDDGTGGRTTNYTGTLEDAFGCIAQVGGGGCGFEQPLSAAARAVTNPDNAGFLRDEAMLVVIILTDEDDCSAEGTTLFENDPTEMFGPFTSYRCFHEGVMCNEDLDSEGVKTDCVSREDNPIMKSVGAVRDALLAVKGGDPTKVMVALIAGDDEPTEVALIPPPGGTPKLTLLESCVDDTDPANPGTAYPAHRLGSFVDLFSGLSWRESICDDIDPALIHTANAVGDIAARRPCLRGELKDTDRDAAGVQPSCRAFLATAAYTPAEQRVEVEECRGHDGNCFQITRDATSCSQWPDSLAVELVGVTQQADQDLIVECVGAD